MPTTARGPPQNGYRSTACEIGGVENCGNCVDDDGNGQVDFEDAACCGARAPAELTLTRALIRPAGTTSKLKLSGVSPEARGAGGDVVVQLRPQGGSPFCAVIPAAGLRGKPGKATRCKDPRATVAEALGVNAVTLRPGRGGSTKVKIGGKKATLTPPAPGQLVVTLGFRAGDAASSRCVSTTKEFKASRRGGLQFP